MKREKNYANPYLPLWEHVPDGEARVFDDPDNPGKKRLYLVGSHDVRRDSYCGADIRIWSAPTTDLTDWRDEGAVYTYLAPNGLWDIMYAPDLVEVKYRSGEKKYILYPHSRGPGREALVCAGPTPVGPFEPLNMNDKGELLPGSFIGFDPSVYVEQIEDPADPDYDIGFRAYVYYGFQNSFVAELDQSTMWTVRPGTEIVEHFIPSSHSYGNLRDPEGTTYPHVMEQADETRFNFFEASSIRKIGNKYLLIFSGYSGPDYGLESTNSSLRYGFGDSPLGPWKAGGVLVDSRGPVLNQDGTALETSNTWHNTHGGLEEVEGQWYCFYHRPPRNYGFSRQAVVAPVSIQWDETPVSEGGIVTIRAYDPHAENGIWTAKASNGFEYTGAQVTSEGFNAYGLPLYHYYSAGIASYLSNVSTLADNYDIWDNHMPIVNVTSGDIIGFQHFDFRDAKADTKLNLWLTPKTKTPFAIHVWANGPWDNDTWKGKKLGTIQVTDDTCTCGVISHSDYSDLSTNEGTDASDPVKKFTLDISLKMDGLSKKHGIFLVAEGQEDALFDLIGLGFSSSQELERIAPPVISIKVEGVPLILPKDPTPSTLENGILGYNRYDVTYITTKNVAEVEDIAASADDSEVKIEIEIIDKNVGEYKIDFDYNGVIKEYYLHITPPSNKEEEVEYFIARNNPIFEHGVFQSWNEEISGFNTKDGNSAVSVILDVAEAGEYELALTHNAFVDPSTHVIRVNDTYETTINYRSGGWLKTALPETVHLLEGENKVRIESVAGEVDLRVIALSKMK